MADYDDNKRVSALTANAAALAGGDLFPILPGATGPLLSETLTRLRAAFGAAGALPLAGFTVPADLAAYLTTAAAAAAYLTIANAASTYLPLAGGVLTGQLREVGFAYKAADEVVNNSSTLQDDNHLTANMVTGRKYLVRGSLPISTADVAGFKLAFAGTATHTNLAISVVFGLGAAAGPATPQTADIITAAATSVGLVDAVNVVLFEGTSECSGTGTFLLRWAQHDARVSDTTVKRGAYLQVKEIG